MFLSTPKQFHPSETISETATYTLTFTVYHFAGKIVPVQGKVQKNLKKQAFTVTCAPRYFCPGRENAISLPTTFARDDSGSIE